MSNDIERSALMRTICESPDDDTPRLVFADWLQEHGEDERAEFIRLQCQLASMKEWDESYHSVRLRVHAIGTRCQEQWDSECWDVSPIRITESGHRIIPRYASGFPAHVHLRPESFIRHHEWLFAETPIRSVTVLVYLSVFPQLLQCEGLRKLSRLVLLASSRMWDRPMEEFAQSNKLGNLRSLAFPGWRLSPESVRSLMRLPILTQLESLDLARHQELDDTCMEQLSNAPELRSLQRFAMNSNNISSEGFSTLLRSPMLKSVRHLDWRDNWHLDDEVASSKEWNQFRHLESLNLSDCRLGAKGCVSLGESGVFDSLQSLNLRKNSLHELTPERLAKCFRGSRFRSLDLSGCYLDRHTVYSLTKSSGASELSQLCIDGNQLGDREWIHILEELPNLRQLSITGDEITNSGWLEVSRLSPTNIEFLSIEAANFCPATVRAVLSGTVFPKLVSLRLSLSVPKAGPVIDAIAREPACSRLLEFAVVDTEIPGFALETLAGSPHLGQLCNLELSDGLSPEFIRIQERFGAICDLNGEIPF